MLGTMLHESFYDSGTHSVPEMGIHAGWVALENSFAANQVFFNERRDIALLFSGECFFDPETKAALKANGHSFSGRGGDCLPHLYEERGESFFEKLNGLFSGLLIDQRLGKAFLFNDRYGVERIYWHETEDAVYFAGEAKALLRVLPDLREFDLEGVAQFLKFGCTLESRTLFRGIQLLPGASVWTFENRGCSKRKYFLPETWESQSELPVEAFESEFQSTFAHILPRYFESESKIGISLTAGLDSRMMVACRPHTSRKEVCYTFDGAEGTTLDARLAARVADTCGLKHDVVRIQQDFFTNFVSHADKTVFIADGCFGIIGTHEIYLNRKARQIAAVRLAGAFGGEVLRGVSTFKPVPFSPDFVHADLQRITDSVSLVPENRHPVSSAVFQEIPWNIYGSPAVCRSQLNFRTPYLDNQIVGLAYRMPPSLRNSPMPAIHLIENKSPDLARIPTDMGLLGETTNLLRTINRLFSKVTFKLDYYNNEGLPHRLSPFEPFLKRISSSFGIVGLHKYLHYRSWFRHELAEFVREAVLQSATDAAAFFNPAFLDTMAAQHISGRRNYVLEINALLTLGAIRRTLLRGFPSAEEPKRSRREKVQAGSF